MLGLRFSLAPMLALLVFVASAGVIWLAHIEAGEMTLDRRPPLVKASTAPMKRSPADPGGSDVADLGGVGDLLRDRPAETEERLLPRPEQPVTPSDSARAPADSERLDANAALEALVSEVRSDRPAGAETGGGGDRTSASSATPSRSASSEPVTPRTVDSPAGGTASPATETPADPASANTASANTEVATLSPSFEATAGGRYRVQLAAVREEEDAKRAWDLFQEQLGPFITGLQPFFERAETSNGIFYRVQVGPFAETAEADRLCVELKKQNASCFVVTR